MIRNERYYNATYELRDNHLFMDTIYVCVKCSALVLYPVVHDQWHEDSDKRVIG